MYTALGHRCRFGILVVALALGHAAPAVAQVDIAGEWAARVHEDQPHRGPGAELGDYSGVPINEAARQKARSWDASILSLPEEVAKPHAPQYFMRGPGPNMRVTKVTDPATQTLLAFTIEGVFGRDDRVIWMDGRRQDEDTLKVDIDNGTQTRLLHFNANARPPATPDWQGFSVAKWESVVEGQSQAPFAGGQNALAGNLSGSVRMTTTHMRPGYLRRNGVPYSANAVLTEFLDRTSEPNGDSWLVMTSIVDDPQYLQIPLMLTTHYKREPDGSKFRPRPCDMTPPVAVR